MEQKFIQDEIMSIQTGCIGKDMSAHFELALHLPDGQILKPPTCIDVDINRDYVGRQSDFTLVSFLLPLGDMVKFVYPQRDNLKITITYYTLGDVSEITYDFVLRDIGPHIKLGSYANRTLTDLNKEFTEVHGECIPESLNALKNTVIYGTYKNCTMFDVLSSAFSKVNADINALIQNNLIEIDIIEPNNTRTYEQILIPDTIDIFKLPYYLQKNYGIYNGGVGVYLQRYKNKDTLFIYPTHRKDSAIKLEETLQVTVANNVTSMGSNGTYAYKGNILKILVDKITSIDHDGETPMKNNGTGIAVTEPRSIVNRPVEITNDDVKTDSIYTKRKQNHKVLKNEQTYVKKQGMTSNGYMERSKILEEDGHRRLYTWSFSNARLLRPFMGVSHIEESEVMQFTNGILQGVHITFDNNSKMEASVLHLFLDTDANSGQVIGGNLSASEISDKIKFL